MSKSIAIVLWITVAIVAFVGGAALYRFLSKREMRILMGEKRYNDLIKTLKLEKQAKKEKEEIARAEKKNAKLKEKAEKKAKGKEKAAEKATNKEKKDMDELAEELVEELAEELSEDLSDELMEKLAATIRANA